ncbi:MAG: hypothetical protein EOL93_04735, partial [Epsilonproteobacteria bacterium]|nr:hypothetical protein [Campylobacterota bacterium]
WFMDGWPGWRLAEASEKAPITHVSYERVALSGSFYKGVAGGTLAGVALYFVIVYLIPFMGSALIIFK